MIQTLDDIFDEIEAWEIKTEWTQYMCPKFEHIAKQVMPMMCSVDRQKVLDEVQGELRRLNVEWIEKNTSSVPSVVRDYYIREADYPLVVVRRYHALNDPSELSGVKIRELRPMLLEYWKENINRELIILLLNLKGM